MISAIANQKTDVQETPLDALAEEMQRHTTALDEESKRHGAVVAKILEATRQMNVYT